MNPKFIKLDDKLGIKKDLIIGKQNKTFRTSVDAVDQFGNILFSKAQNNVVLGGSIYVLEKLLNIRASLQVEDLNTIMGIMTDKPIFTADDIIPRDHCVCLWGVGIGGSGDNIGSVRPVNFYEREIGSNGNSMEMVPFRVVENDLSNTDKENYFFHKDLQDGFTAYYLKAFQSQPVIKAFFDDGIDDDDGTEVTETVYNTTSKKNIEVFAEINLFLTKKDVREYFNLLGEIEKARINTIALCTGIKVEYEPGKYDYSHVLMITKLNFGNEMLENKEITFRYRIFTN